MMSGVSQKEYLKRYLQKDPDKKAKKKKKKHSAISSSTHLKRSVIIDDDVNLNDLPLGEDGQLDLEQLGDEAPQIVGIIDERPEIVKLEEKYKSGKWRPMGEEGGHTESKMGGDKRTYFEAGGDRHKQQDDTKRSDDSDLSPPRVNPKRAPDGKRRDTAPTKSNEREANGSDSDLEVPRRRRRNNSHSPASRETKRHKDEKHQKSEDSDLSPPRRDRKDGSRDVSKIKSKNRDRLRKGSDSDIEVPRKTQNRGSDSDLSPPRHSRSGNSHGDKTSEKTERSSSRWDGSKKPSSFRGREVDSDQSPPRRGNGGEPRNRKGRGNSNFSPPRRHKDGRKADMTPPKRRKADPEADLSPPRRRKDGRDAASSPPRRRKADPEADLSPLRRRKDGRDADSSLRRRKADPEADLSPPRRRKDGRDADSSLRRRKADPEADLSPPRRRKDGNDSDLSPPRKNKNTEDKRDRSNSDKMGDGKRAGLQDAKSLKDELRLLKEKEDEMFRKMDPELLGARSAAVVRDRKTGLKRDFEKEREIERKKSAKAAVRQKKYEKWGKGLKQIQEQEERVADMIHEMSKPLARYAGDDDLERALKAQEREGDPMLEYIKSHQKDSHTIDLTVGGVRKKYMGSFLPNRFNIAPGHRWDGVDRSNGYEQKWFAAKNAKQATAEEAWKWSSADM